jgi:VIT1/CCC1 family predicted Fe2+/Mn2+ transporter
MHAGPVHDQELARAQRAVDHARMPALSAKHRETHRSGRAAWLRAAVLGSDDAIVSTSSLMLGVAAASASRETILTAGVAGLVAGAMSMAAGEYVSVSSQRDAEHADIELEKRELAHSPHAEARELATIYMKRGLDPELAHRVAEQLGEHDVLGAHLRDELGLDPQALAQPLQAAVASAVSFAVSAALPIVALLVAPAALRAPTIVGVSITCLAGLGALGGYLGGAPIGRAALRVTLGGGLAMLVTSAVGHLLGPG